jgi:hypothetical protein
LESERHNNRRRKRKMPPMQRIREGDTDTVEMAGNLFEQLVTHK